MSDKRKTFNMTFNKGIDKSSLPFEADPSRALEAVNYIYRDGKVQKRFGVLNVLNAADDYEYYSRDPITDVVSDSKKTNTKRLNGLWYFLAEDGNYHLIAHIGKLLCEIVKEDATPWGDANYDGHLYESRFTIFIPHNVHMAKRPQCYEFNDYKSVAVVANKRLYFFGGNALMVLKYTSGGSAVFEPLEDGADTYIPTTTISITPRNSSIAGRASLDQVNLMTQWRKNKLISGTAMNEDAERSAFDRLPTYILDGPIVGKKQYNVWNVRVKIAWRK